MIKVQLTVNAKGGVDAIEFLTELEPVHKELFRRPIETWLFLPALADGQPRASKVVIPLTFAATH